MGYQNRFDLDVQDSWNGGDSVLACQHIARVPEEPAQRHEARLHLELQTGIDEAFVPFDDHAEIFYTLREAKALIEQWRQHYNRLRPHSALATDLVRLRRSGLARQVSSRSTWRLLED